MLLFGKPEGSLDESKTTQAPGAGQQRILYNPYERFEFPYSEIKYSAIHTYM